MVRLLTISLLAIGLAGQALATEDSPAPTLEIIPAAGFDRAEYLWKNRLIVVFDVSEFSPDFVEQMENIAAEAASLFERDVIVVTDTSPDGESAIRQDLRPRAFTLVFIDRDGQVKLRKPTPWTVRELTRSIDKFEE